MAKLHKKFGFCLGTILAFSLFPVFPAKSSPGESNQQDARSRTTVRFCNQTSSAISIAIGYWAGDEGWKSRGWLNVEAGDCRVRDLENYEGDFYYYARGRSGVWNGDGNAFCITDEGFQFPDADRMSCSGSNRRRVAMRDIYLDRGQTQTLTFN